MTPNLNTLSRLNIQILPDRLRVGDRPVVRPVHTQNTVNIDVQEVPKVARPLLTTQDHKNLRSRVHCDCLHNIQLTRWLPSDFSALKFRTAIHRRPSTYTGKKIRLLAWESFDISVEFAKPTQLSCPSYGVRSTFFHTTKTEPPTNYIIT
jgi:hypothetical protein